MNKFKIGDKVRLRDDLELGKEYGEIKFLSGMKDSQGKVLTIEEIRQNKYILDECDYFCSEEMLEKVIDDTDDLLEFALSKLNMTKEELRREHKKNKISEQDLENIKKCCDDFEDYCNSRGCNTCDIYKFKERNNIKGLGTKSCMLIYEYLFEK